MLPIEFNANRLMSANLSDASIQNLKSGLRGTLIGPGDAGYDEARKVYNAMIDKKPCLIAMRSQNLAAAK